MSNKTASLPPSSGNQSISKSDDESIDEQHEVPAPKRPTTFTDLYTDLSNKKRKLQNDRIPLKQKRNETFESYKVAEAELNTVQNEIVAINNSIYQLVMLHHPPMSYDNSGDEKFSYDNGYLKFDQRSANTCNSTNKTEWITITAKKF